jgi:hypothetical protein
MRLLTASIVGTVLLACVAPVRGYDGMGGIDLEARPSVQALAMGETGVVETRNCAGFGANPAMLTWAPAGGVALSHGSLVEGLSTSATSFCAAVPLGASVNVPSLGDVGRRFCVGISLDHSGVELSRGTDWGWDLLSLGASYRLAPYASAGLTGKYLFSTSDLEGSDVRAFGVDAGAILEMTPVLRLALSLRNIAGKATWEDGEDETPPFGLGLGAGLSLPYQVLGHMTFTYSSGAPGKLGFGLDVPISTTGFSLRGGYLYHAGDRSRSTYTAGFGYAYGAVVVDYAVKLDEELVLGTTHHFSIGLMFP